MRTLAVMRLRTLDDAGRPATIPWVWRLPGAGIAEPVYPIGALAALALGWTAAALIFGPVVLAISVFSPVSTTSILTAILIAMRTGKAIARHKERTREAFLGRGACPSCAYGLAGITPGSGGLTLCPECGCAWDMRPVRTEVRVIADADLAQTTLPPATTARGEEGNS